MEELDEYIDKCENLPPAPNVLPELMAVLKEPNLDCGKVVTLIGHDPSLTASVLQYCNSAFFAAAQPADDLEEAVMRLGLQPVFNLVATISGSKTFASVKTGSLNPEELWMHSVTAAVAAKVIAAERGDDEDQVFTAALLHDLGKTVLADAMGSIYDKLLEEAEGNQSSMLCTEKRLLGVQHAEIGGRLLVRWKFPESLIKAVWHHHEPEAAEPYASLAAQVFMGSYLAHFLGNGIGATPITVQGRESAMQILNITTSQYPQIIEATFRELENIKALFKMGN